MPQEISLWQQAKKQAKQIKKLKNKSSKRRQVVLLCETWKKALNLCGICWVKIRESENG